MINRHSARQPSHPGALLRAFVFPALGLSQSEIAARIGISKNAISLLCKERLRVGVDVALKLQRLCGVDAQTLLQMQMRHDIWEASRNDDLSTIEPVTA